MLTKSICKKCLYTFEGTGNICNDCLAIKSSLRQYLGNNYYVYEFIRLDNNEPFYVSKGKNNQIFRKLPSSKEKRLSETIKLLDELGLKYAVSIIYKDLEEDIATTLEKQVINEYVYEFGYNLRNTAFSESRSEQHRELWRDEEFREKTVAKTKEAMQDDIVRLQCSNGAKRAWEDEEYRSKVIAALKRPRKSAPKKKNQILVKNVETNETILDIEGITNVKNELAKIGIGSKKFQKLKQGEQVENLMMTILDKN